MMRPVAGAAKLYARASRVMPSEDDHDVATLLDQALRALDAEFGYVSVLFGGDGRRWKI